MSTTLTYRGPSLEVLHAEYAKEHRIDTAAPLRAQQETVINAPVGRVWEVLTDVAGWGTNLEPGVRDIHVPEGVVVDAPFTRSNKGFRMTSRFAIVAVDRELAWTGSAFGMKVVHRIELASLPDGATRVVTQESMAGPLLAVLFSRAKLLAVLATSMAALRSAAEHTRSPAR